MNFRKKKNTLAFEFSLKKTLLFKLGQATPWSQMLLNSIFKGRRVVILALLGPAGSQLTLKMQ